MPLIDYTLQQRDRFPGKKYYTSYPASIGSRIDLDGRRKAKLPGTTLCWGWLLDVAATIEEFAKAKNTDIPG